MDKKFILRIGSHYIGFVADDLIETTPDKLFAKSYETIGDAMREAIFINETYKYPIVSVEEWEK